MALNQPCAKYSYLATPAGPRTIPDAPPKDEESPADYNAGGYLQVNLRDTFKDGRYVVVRKLGWGHFSTVWLVKDIQDHRHSALKVVKSAGRYAETARDEIKLLSQVRDESPEHPGRDHVVTFLDSFSHVGPEGVHICMVFEPLGENLLALIERHKKTGVAPALVKVVAKQILLGLEYLHDECDLIHTDIKPENIMVSIPDVEAYIQEELSKSPSPTSRKVGVPPRQLGRAGLTIPRYSTGRERHVQIFESQPLTSPSSLSSYSAASSLNVQNGLQMSRMTSIHSIVDLMDKKRLTKQGSTSFHSGGSTPDLSTGSSEGSDGSRLATSSLAASFSNETSLTSVAKLTSEVNKLSIMTRQCHDGMCACICQEASVDKEVMSEAAGPHAHQQLSKPHTGPSLLSQTAPHDLHSNIISESVHSTHHSPSPPPTPSPPPSALPLVFKIADLGNATPSHRHYTEDIQTRQYRSPEVILGRTDWLATADIWSAACVIFELLTAEYLFDPQSQGGVFGKDDDHMAQIIELLGNFDAEVKFGGRFSRELFDSTGALRYIRTLKPWPLKRVMVEKYAWSEQDAEALCEFLEPMLVIDHRKRKHARDMKEHKWLDVDLSSPELVGW
ncbi:kinase-like protein [Wolfiporia cocos MD-104 SS10]|uniref:non-specific serine/threonine protein kinase n=1 Tax=Wolfiporia cocos (strain MD-104) TaxID=742152 RepID=A0A2H3J6L8_WOLCO|nr:kinase-like protein [Wolfiporia cocos MD-104 SS10]